jgi:uncharacterized membrane protein
MSDLIVVAFDHFDDARSAMRALRAIEDQDQIKFEDSAIVERAPDGKLHVKNELTGATETGAAVGAFVGAFLMFFFPVVGLVLGAAGGAAVGAMLKTGVEKSFVNEVKDKLSPGRSALFLVIKSGSADTLVAALEPFKGEVIQTNLEPDTEEELRRVLAV